MNSLPASVIVAVVLVFYVAQGNAAMWFDLGGNGSLKGLYLMRNSH